MRVSLAAFQSFATYIIITSLYDAVVECKKKKRQKPSSQRYANGHHTERAHVFDDEEEGNSAMINKESGGSTKSEPNSPDESVKFDVIRQLIERIQTWSSAVARRQPVTLGLKRGKVVEVRTGQRTNLLENTAMAVGQVAHRQASIQNVEEGIAVCTQMLVRRTDELSNTLGRISDQNNSMRIKLMADLSPRKDETDKP